MSAFETLARYVPPRVVAWSAVAVMVAFVTLVGVLVVAIIVGFEFKLAGVVFGRDPDWRPITTQEANNLPLGVVVASQRRCADLGVGWRTYDAAAGRVIVGAGTETISGYTRTFLFEEEGDYWAHTLTVDEMPSHSHTVGRQTDVTARDDNAFLARGAAPSMADNRTGATGGGQPHNNMPPYIVLYLCSRED